MLHRYVIGGSDAAVEGTWKWQDGTTWGYTYWRSPPDNANNEDCLEVTPDGTWNDIDCSVTARQYLCASSGAADVILF